MNNIFEYLDYLFENPKCELEYNNDFEFLIAVVLSAQTTDKKVNSVTKELFSKYDMYSLKDAPINDLINILKPLGMSIKKASFIKNIKLLISLILSILLLKIYQKKLQKHIMVLFLMI